MTKHHQPLTDYKVSAASRHTDKRWKSKTIAEVGISYGQPFHEGRKFDSLLHWTARKFDKVFITLSDTLYRHNYEAEGHCPKVALNIARTYGDMWLARNKKFLNKYDKEQLSIIRWDTFRYHADFDNLYDDLMRFRLEDKGFQAAIAQDTQDYLHRNKDTIKGDDSFLHHRKSLDYVMEEIVVYTLIGREMKSARIYPGQDLESFKYMRQPHIPAHLKGLNQSPHVHLSFQRKASVAKEEAA